MIPSFLLCALLVSPQAGGASLETVTRRVLPIAGTEVHVSLPLPGVIETPDRLAALRKARTDHLLFACDLGSQDVRLLVDGGFAGLHGPVEWRRVGLGERAAGAFQWEHDHVAFSEAIRPLTAPYRDFDRQAFVVAGGAVVHVQIVALEGEDPERFGRARFEAVADGARFAVVRRGTWDDLPAAYLELSHQACLRTDGLAWLAQRAEAEGAGWLEHLVLAQHALARPPRNSDAEAEVAAGVDVVQHSEAALAGLATIPAPSRTDTAARMLAEDGLGLGLIARGEVEAGERHLQAALALARDLGGAAPAGITADLALARAAAGDAEGTAKLLREAFEADASLVERMVRNPLFDAVRTDPRVAPLLVPPKPPGPGRALGH